MIQSKLKSENLYSRQQEMKKFIFGGINIFGAFYSSPAIAKMKLSSAVLLAPCIT